MSGFISDRGQRQQLKDASVQEVTDDQWMRGYKEK